MVKNFPLIFLIKSKKLYNLLIYWWASSESNRAPTDYESAALTKHELEARLTQFSEFSMKLRSRSEREGWRNLRRALASI